MNGRQGHTHTTVRKSGEPARVSLLIICKMQPEGFDQHRVGSLLCDQAPSRLRIAHLAQHTFDRPAQRLSLRLILEHHYGRQNIEQKAGISFQLEMAAESKEAIAGAYGKNAIIPFAF